MSVDYKQYRRSQIAELADWEPGFDMESVSISDADKQAGSPKHGDKIARNPANHADKWLVAADYFAANFEPIDAAIKAAQPQEYPSTADDEATRWRHGEPSAISDERPGWVSVPREPTREMWDAAWNSIGLPYRAKLSMHEIKTLFDKFHSAMLAAALAIAKERA